jgi:bis(5'-nucleosidyl)-tetraphosphatase
MCEKQTSAGWIIFNDDKVLLIKNSLGHWDFPKGRVEKGESLEKAAYRELEEETGLEKSDIMKVEGFKETIAYTFPYPGEEKKICKDVYFFLAFLIAPTDEIKLSDEHTAYKWASPSQAFKLLKYDNQKSVLKKALEFINKPLSAEF